MMNLERIGPAEIFRPSLDVETAVRAAAEAHFRAEVAPGVYRDPREISRVLNRQFEFHQREIDSILPELASHHFNEFLLFQYDQTTKINESAKKGYLSPTDAERWRSIGPVLRRGLKFLCERVVQLQPPEPPPAPEDRIVALMDRLWVAAEEGTRAYLLSDQTHGMFPNATTLTVFAPGADDRYFDLSVDNLPDYESAVRRDREYRGRYVGSPGDVPLYDPDLRAAHLDGPLGAALGATYTQAVGLLSHIVQHSAPAPGGFPVLFLARSAIARVAAELQGLSPEAVDLVLDGFTVGPAGLESEGRSLFKPKQEHRAFRRGFLAMPDGSGPHIAFSRSMAQEALVQLIQGFSFKKAPDEWRAAAEAAGVADALKDGLEAVSKAGGRWLENILEERLRERGFFGRGSLTALGQGESRLQVPGDVGEIDYLGYHPGQRLLLVGEAKLVQEASEPTLMRDDLADFTREKKGYATKLRRKVGWVRDRLPAVAEALATDVGRPVEPTRMAVVLVTYTPTVAASAISDFPCVSLTNLLFDYDRVDGWPYALGLESVVPETGGAVS